MPETLSHKWFPAHGNPEIPKPEAHEYPDIEFLIHEAIKHYNQSVPTRHDKVLVPRYNHLYGTNRTEGGWRYGIDNYAAGTLTTVAGAAVSTPVKLAVSPPNWRLEQWPGATTLFIAIRTFSLAPQTATFATAGALDCYYQDLAGMTVPLGDFISSGANNIGLATLIPSPVTDPGAINIGNLLVTLNAGATVGTYNWQLAFAAAYLIPAIKGYDVEYIGNIQSHEHNRHPN